MNFLSRSRSLKTRVACVLFAIYGLLISPTLLQGSISSIPANQNEQSAGTQTADTQTAVQDKPLEIPPPKKPTIAEASNEGLLSMGTIKLPPGVSATLFAAEPDVANPVAIDVTVDGRVFVCESFRQERGIEDNRNHPEWLNDDLTSRSIEDRLAYMKKHLGDKILTYSEQDDRIRLLRDTNGDGRADTSEVFADGFNQPEDGTGAGVLSVGDKVWYTNIPHLWSLEKNEDGTLERTKVHSGFGVRFAFRGHDMHGLTIGPDGRLYFSIGDRGYNLGNDIVNYESGAVFRCELDGSGLEVFATGLRNPQELAFDDWGNLFTGDNNSDSGIDQARLVYLVEGGDSGWRMNYQYLDDRGPFVSEGIWDPTNASAPAYIVPPVAIIGDGPSGLTYYPGTGWSEDFNNRFFMCDFRGQANLSGIRTFRVKPKGASFEMIDEEQSIWQVLATDIDFSVDGRLFVSDWVESWDGVGKGRIYSLQHSNAVDNPIVAKVTELLRGGLSEKTNQELGALLSHVDQRVRMEAQFELVRRNGFDEFIHYMAGRQAVLAQLHSLWGISQMLRSGLELSADQELNLTNALSELSKSKDWQIRAHISKFIGENHLDKFMVTLTTGLTDLNLHVQFHSGMALGKIGTTDQLGDITKFLANNSRDVQDPMLRHAGIMALVGIAKDYRQTLKTTTNMQEYLSDHPLRPAFSHNNPSVRLACTIAFRNLNSPLVILGIASKNEQVALEAARAIYDSPRRNTYKQLAGLLNSTPHNSVPLLRRMMHANYLVGQSEHASSLSGFISTASKPIELRVEAMTLLGNWRQPDPQDKINGRIRYTRERRTLAIKLLVSRLWDQMLEEPEELQLAYLNAVRQLNVTLVAKKLGAYANNSEIDITIRKAALTALSEMKVKGLGEVISQIIDADVPELRSVALRVLSKTDPKTAVTYLNKSIESENLQQRQEAFRTLAAMSDADSMATINAALNRFMEFPADTRLDVYAAAEARVGELKQTQLAELNKHILTFTNGSHEMTLLGGDSKNGAKVFQEADLSCVRCHKVGDVGGNIGPDLSKIATDKSRAYLLRSIIKPNEEIAEGFGSFMILDIDGKTHVGIIKFQNDERIELMDDQGVVTTILQADIDEIKKTKSAMPDDVTEKLSLVEIRDLIEYLSSLK